ncbi:MAG: SGNH/GDSL hydrolase family protein [Planctomycetota bacterium JB042]
MATVREKLSAATVVPLLLAALTEFAVVTCGIAPPESSPLVLWNPRRDADLNTDEGEFRRHHAWLWEPRPGVVVHGDAINEDAMRGPPVARDDRAALRIAVLGDSTTYGFGLREHDSWGRDLERFLRALDVDVEVLNGGVIGYSIEQGYRLYLGKIRPFRPDVVVAAFGAVNEHFKDLSTDRAKIDLLSHPLFRLRQLLERYAAFRLLERAIEGAPEVRELDEDDVTPRVPVREFRRRIADLKRAVEEDGGRLVLVSPPRRLDAEARWPDLIDYTEALEEAAKAEGIPLAPVRREFQSRDEVALGDRFREPSVAKDSPFFIDQWHPSVRGHVVYAGTVGLTLLQAGLLPQLEGREDVVALLEGAKARAEPGSNGPPGEDEPAEADDG